MVKKLTAKNVIHNALPDLLVEDDHTTSSALKKATFIGPLRERTSFLGSVWGLTNVEQWSKKVVDHNLATRDLHRELVSMGDEHGV
ncbi:hypothetical protein CBS147332_993 [Penicillium roqueforti]|nr:hypothetical protein CBS147332_993 [Penicillium roqueforti]KAI3122554.1 hypothetical protein CBS147331_1004 [Penicillium roqueforti]